MGAFEVTVGTVARIRVERDATTEFPVAEKVRGGWQTGVHHYPDDSVAEVLGIYIWHPREVHRAVLDSATEEAIARYDGDVDRETGAAVDDWGYSECQRQAFVAGALFESGRAPRTVTTVEELDALAVGSVVLNANGYPWRKGGRNWYVAGATGGSRQIPYLPGIVLYEPHPGG